MNGRRKELNALVGKSFPLSFHGIPIRITISGNLCILILIVQDGIIKRAGLETTKIFTLINARILSNRKLASPEDVPVGEFYHLKLEQMYLSSSETMNSSPFISQSAHA